MRRPPRLAERLARLALPPGDHGLSMLGDLREELATGSCPSPYPALWYWRQVLALSLRYILLRLAGAFLSSTPTPRTSWPSYDPPRHPRKGASMFETLRQDLVYALRGFTRNPGFTAIALVILTLGIGATTSIFSVVDAVLLRSLPYDEPERIVRLRHGHVEHGFVGADGGGGFSPPDFEDLAGEVRSFKSLAAYRFVPGQSTANLTGDGRPERIDVAVVSADFFQVLGRDAALGRTLTAGDVVPGHDNVVVLSHALWKGRFGGDPDIAGRVITLNNGPMQVIGVMPPSFQFPSQEAQAWTPISLITEDMIPRRRQLRWMQSVGRLAHGVDEAEARAELTAVLSRLEDAYPDSNEGWTMAQVTPLYDTLVGGVRPALLVLLAATVLVLLVACANLANLLLARGTGRRREIAVRMSLGASRTRLVRQLLTESLLLSIIGGVLGLALAGWGVRILVAMSAGTLPRSDAIGPDPRVAGFALLASLLTGLVFGLLPALTTARARPAAALRDAATSASGGRRTTLRGLLVVGETALAALLVIGSGLMLKSFWKLVRVDPGFETESVLTLSIRSPSDIPARQGEEDRRRILMRYRDEILTAIGQVPGVISVGASKTSPLVAGGEPFEITAVDASGNERTIRPDSGMQIVTPGYFETLGIPVLRGRTFTDRDPPLAVVVNQAFAEQYWPGDDVVGKHFGSARTQLEIVGVVAGVRHEGMATPSRGALYLSSQAAPRSAMNVYVRTATDPLALAGAVRRAVWSINPDQPVADLGLLTRAIDADVAQPRFFATLLAAFAALALVLAALGIYGVVSYTVGQRRGELGIRMALGARGGDVLRLVVSQAMAVCLAGLALGILGAFWLSRVLSGLLYGVEPRDPLTFAAVAVLLVGVSLVASWVPARRATRVDPVLALRSD